MQQILDLHIHSKYSRACSKELTLANIDRACRIKGVDIIATGDFTYPAWFNDIKNELDPSASSGQEKSGLYVLKEAKDQKIKFILSTEFALIYKQGDKCRRIHLVIHAPNIAAVEELNKYLDKKYNIRSDGRPILGMSSSDLIKLCLSIHPQFLIYPAHIWTPWFSVYGSKSGFDSFAECFGDYEKDVFAYETGLSSDPEMNWRVSALDKLTLLSNSDAHSLPNIAREANVFEMNEISYNEIYEIIKNKKIYNKDNGIKYTIEFYPEEGMYHFDGHRDCGVSFTPEQTKKNKGLCPKCKKPLVIGVLYRVEELADRPTFAKATAGEPIGLNPPANQTKFVKLVELDKIIAEALGIKSRHSRAVQAEYNNIIKGGGSELDILINKPIEELKKITLPIIAEGISRMRAGNLIIKPGFDGQYGEINIFKEGEKGKRQKQLF